jgi:hypothetical protein|tara:strand:- start:588 stop:755 length:168 start_codon:yes stop_codon:yes gene_type:complete
MKKKTKDKKFKPYSIMVDGKLMSFNSYKTFFNTIKNIYQDGIKNMPSRNSLKIKA